MDSIKDLILGPFCSVCCIFLLTFTVAETRVLYTLGGKFVPKWPFNSGRGRTESLEIRSFTLRLLKTAQSFKFRPEPSRWLSGSPWCRIAWFLSTYCWSAFSGKVKKPAENLLTARHRSAEAGNICWIYSNSKNDRGFSIFLEFLMHDAQ